MCSAQTSVREPSFFSHGVCIFEARGRLRACNLYFIVCFHATLIIISSVTFSRFEKVHRSNRRPKLRDPNSLRTVWFVFSCALELWNDAEYSIVNVQFNPNHTTFLSDPENLLLNYIVSTTFFRYLNRYDKI